LDSTLFQRALAVHHTADRGQMSTEKTITASIVQGSGVGPASYFVVAGDQEISKLSTMLIA